jgi:hypothetical protein
MNFNRIVSSLRKELKKPNGNTSGRSFIAAWDTKKITTYSKEVVNTKLDPKLKGGQEYGKPVRFLTDKEIKDLKQTNNLEGSRNPGLLNKSKKVQDYMDRKNRQI